MNRCVLLIGLAISLPACWIRPGKVILIEDTKDCYVVLREGRAGYVLTRNGQVENRTDLKDLREVHGDLEFICSEIHGVGSPRIVIESKNKRNYQVMYKWEDRQALDVIAKPLGLVVAKEEREIQAITIRVLPGGPRLKPAAKDKLLKVKDVYCDTDGRWPLDGANADDLARFLENRYRRPVANLTSLEGRWSILLSEKAGKSWPAAGEKIQLDNLGLEMQWERVNLLVTVVKDKVK